MVLHKIDIYWLLIVGPIDIVLLSLLLLTYFIPATLNQPADIILSTAIYNFVLVISLTTQAVYYLVYDPTVIPTAPANFDTFC